MTATERAYSEIKRRIMDMTLAPNEHVLEAELAQDLGVSRTPIREAVLMLRSDGLVDIVPRRGVRIRPVSADQLEGIYDVLALLEARAAELAATRQSSARIAALDSAVASMSSALRERDLDGWEGADDDFHRLLVEASENDYLVAAARTSVDRVRRARRMTMRLRPLPTESVRDHAELVALIRAGRAADAFASHLAHRRRAAELLVTLLRENRLVV
ncbi:DNA-binding GntR family transcriptional regulator [Ilumatobacter fluminis]|uniref:DNA-binding GntR family transcriptional regulator n=2 Tax=Ilumatobacter fluminis TaxID=467091 RepID=A0A4R7HWP4_9ACTN|nr:DNA-binding GntR family transcriptional regulator [Ilumatobacter fluminis]